MTSQAGRFEFAVVGGGLFGSATARHLAQAGSRVLLLAPSEPLRRESHDGVFASHYDESRITRGLDPDPLWGDLALASIARYAEIERGVGERFHYPRGFLWLSDRVERTAAMARNGREAQVAFEALELSELKRRLPALTAAPRQEALLEAVPAGYINPRRLVAAQIELARADGATVIAQTALQVTETPDGVDLFCNTGDRYLADRVLIAAGAYTNNLLVRPLDLELQGRLLLFAEMAAEQASTLADLPVLIHESGGEPNFFMVPPVTYPDGKTYLKFGFDEADHPLRSDREIGDWFRHGADPEEVRATLEAVTEVYPELAGLPVHSESCVYTVTASGHPYIGMLNSRVGVLVGGNGKGAKSSDEIGRLGALALQGETLDERLTPRLAD